MEEQIRHFGYFRSVTALAVLILLFAWETSAPFVPLFGEQRAERLRHGGRNLCLGLINSLIATLGVVALWAWVAQWAATHQFGILHWFPLPLLPRLVLALLLFDLWMYWWHRMNHRFAFFWRFHRTHHSDPKMDVTTAHRFHFGEIFLSALFRVPVIVLLGLQLSQLALYEILMFAVVQLHHANIAFPPRLDRFLRGIIVTPSIHKVHHSRLRSETDSNYSSLFSWWDRIFRTLKLRRDPSTINYGLVDFDAPNRQTIGGLLKTPLGENSERR